MAFMTDESVSSQHIVSKYGISYQTLNYYTNLGFLSAVTKQGNRRLYRDDEVRRTLLTIRQLKSQGFSLKLIGRLLRGVGNMAALEGWLGRG